jgi:DNA-binding GntR family transcriptional regulator
MLAAIIARDTAAAMLATRQHIEAGWQELRDAIAAGDPAIHTGV